jgi:phage/plasmid-associated DNA primase
MTTFTETMKPTVEKFAAEKLVITKDCHDYITSKKLYSIFLQWCKENDVQNCTQNVFIINIKTVKGLTHEQQREPDRYQLQNAVHMFRFVKVREPTK